MSSAGEGLAVERTRGFTLIELCVAMAVMAILAMIAVPAFYNTLRAHQLQETGNALRGALAYARTEAVLRQYSVSICASGGGTTCSGSADYSLGWLIYTTPGAANTLYSAGGTMVLLRSGQGDSHVSALASTTGAISFSPQGAVVGGSGVSFTSCPRTGTTGNGASTSSLPGSTLTVTAQGSLYVQPLGVQATCTATTAT
ncbi:GspH/FimT family pseudopilin [Frateuria aurantia]